MSKQTETVAISLDSLPGVDLIINGKDMDINKMIITLAMA